MHSRRIRSSILGVLSLILATSTLGGCGTTQQGLETASQEKVIQGTFMWDIDSNADRAGSDADLWWEHVNRHERYLVPRNGAGLAVVKSKSFEQLGLADLKELEYAKARLSGSDTDTVIKAGTVLALRTTEGRFAKLKVLGFKPLKLRDGDRPKQHIQLRYVLFE